MKEISLQEAIEVALNRGELYGVDKNALRAPITSGNSLSYISSMEKFLVPTKYVYHILYAYKDIPTSPKLSTYKYESAEAFAEENKHVELSSCSIIEFTKTEE